MFWESHFTRLLSREDFNKKYAYSFRHMFGKEGARKNYTPYSCMKIIMGTPPEAGAYHGCPYRLQYNVKLNCLVHSLSYCLDISPMVSSLRCCQD
jgi:DNA primase large subunit